MRTISMFSVLLTIACSSSEANMPNNQTTKKNTIAKKEVLPPPDTTIETNQLHVSTKASLLMAMVEADKKFHVWMEGRSGILRVNPTEVFWLENGGISKVQGTGQMHMEVDGHTYLTTTKPSSVTLTTKIDTAPKNTTQSKITLEMTNKGRYITEIVPEGAKAIKLSSSTDKPARSAIIQVANNGSQFGTEIPTLSTDQLNSAKANHAIPSDAKKLEHTPASAEQVAKWTKDIQALHGASATITWSTSINLDQDEAKEGVLCAIIPKDDSCFVFDTMNGEERYYYLPNVVWAMDANKKPTSSLQAFQLADKTYIGYERVLEKSSVFSTIRFDGSGYTADRL